MPFLHRGDDFGRVHVAGGHVGVGHARHRLVRVGFAPSVAGGRHAHQPGVLAVLHVADQLAVIDQHVAVGRRALVVDGQRTAPFADGAVIDHGDALGSHLLAHQAGEGRRLLAVEVALQPMADCLVQHHARPAGGQHDVERAGGRGDRLEIDQRLPQRLVGGVLPAVLGDELAETLAPAHAVGAGLLAVAFADDDRNVHAHQRPDVAHHLAVGAQDFDMLPATRRARPSPGAPADPWRADRRRFPAAASPCPRSRARRSGFRRHRDGGWCAAGAAASVPE